MEKKITYKATFSNGEVLTRKSHRTYTHAWAVGFDGKFYTYGFSSRYDLAQKAALDYYPTDFEAKHKKERRLWQIKATLKWLNEYWGGNWASYQADRKDRISRMMYEIVPVEIV